VSLGLWYVLLLLLLAILCLLLGIGITWLHALGDTTVLWYMLMYQILAGDQVFTVAWPAIGSPMGCVNIILFDLI
jgi:hypothetical protein